VSVRRAQVPVPADSAPLDGTLQVLVLHDGFQMLRVHAQSHATEMVDLQSFWDGGDVQLVADAVSEHLLVLPGDLAVAGTDRPTKPQPARTIRRSWSDVTIEALLQRPGPTLHE
jgi:hypothetical protein